MLLVDSVGVWSDERASNCDSELHLASLELSIGERWMAYVPLVLFGGRVFRFNLLLACLFLLLPLATPLPAGVDDCEGSVSDPRDTMYEL